MVTFLPANLLPISLYGCIILLSTISYLAVTSVDVYVLGKTMRGVGVGDQWVKLGDGNWEIDGISFQKYLVHLFSCELNLVLCSQILPHRTLSLAVYSSAGACITSDKALCERFWLRETKLNRNGT